MNNLFRHGKNNLSVDASMKGADAPGMKIYADRLGKLLAEENANKISDAQVARDIGVGAKTLNQWKLRASLPRSPNQLMALCRRLRTHPNYLLGWDHDRYPRSSHDRIAEMESEIRNLQEEVRSLRGKKR